MNERLEHALSYSHNRKNGLTVEESLKPRHYVYLVECSGYVKIGKAKDVVARVRAMQTGNPFQIVILAVKPSSTPNRDESELHAKLAQFRMFGEWFKVPEQELKQLVSEMLPGPPTPPRKNKQPRPPRIKRRRRGIDGSKYYRRWQEYEKNSKSVLRCKAPN